MKLKDILDDFGWDKVQAGEFPELETEPNSPVTDRNAIGRYEFALYAQNGVFVMVENGRRVIDICGIAHNPQKMVYERTGSIAHGQRFVPDDIDEFLEGFKELHRFQSELRVPNLSKERTHFQGIGEQIEHAEALYDPSYGKKEEPKSEE